MEKPAWKTGFKQHSSNVYYEYVLEFIGKRSFLQIQTLSVMLGGNSLPKTLMQGLWTHPLVGQVEHTEHEASTDLLVTGWGFPGLFGFAESIPMEIPLNLGGLNCEDTVNLIFLGGTVFFLCLVCI